MKAKLIRDKIPSVLKEKNVSFKTHVATEGEYLMLLSNKLLEESEEFLVSKKPEELADILEVVYVLASIQNISMSELENIRLEKKQERGGFEEKLVLEGIDEE